MTISRVVDLEAGEPENSNHWRYLASRHELLAYGRLMGSAQTEEGSVLMLGLSKLRDKFHGKLKAVRHMFKKVRLPRFQSSRISQRIRPCRFEQAIDDYMEDVSDFEQSSPLETKTPPPTHEQLPGGVNVEYDEFWRLMWSLTEDSTLSGLFNQMWRDSGFLEEEDLEWRCPSNHYDCVTHGDMKSEWWTPKYLELKTEWRMPNYYSKPYRDKRRHCRSHDRQQYEDFSP